MPTRVQLLSQLAADVYGSVTAGQLGCSCAAAAGEGTAAGAGEVLLYLQTWRLRSTVGTWYILGVVTWYSLGVVFLCR